MRKCLVNSTVASQEDNKYISIFDLLLLIIEEEKLKIKGSLIYQEKQRICQSCKSKYNLACFKQGYFERSKNAQV